MFSFVTSCFFRKAQVALSGAIILFSTMVIGEETKIDFELPEKIDEQQFTALKEQSPFTRVLDFAETVRLTGIAIIDGEQVATVRDRQKGDSYVISGKANDQGWKMVGVDSNTDLAEVAATFSVNGGEEITLQFDEKQLNPVPSPKGTRSIQVNRDLARKPPPTQEERKKFGEWVRNRMSKMSDEQKKRVGQIMQEKMKANQNLTDRQKGDIFVKILDYVESGKK